MEYMSEAFDVFNRIAGIRSEKKVTGPALEKIFSRLEKALGQYYAQAQQTLELQLDMLGSNLKTYTGTRFENLPHVQELKTNYEQTKKSLAAVKQLQQKFNEVKGKANDFQFNADKAGALNLQNLENAIEDAMAKTADDTEKADKEVVAQAEKQPEKPVEATPTEEPPAENPNEPGDQTSGSTPEVTPQATPEVTPQVNPASQPKDIKQLKVDPEAQKTISSILDKFISKIKGLVQESEVLEEEMAMDIFDDTNMEKYKKLVTAVSSDVRKKLHVELRKTLGALGYTVKEIKSGISASSKAPEKTSSETSSVAAAVPTKSIEPEKVETSKEVQPEEPEEPETPSQPVEEPKQTPEVPQKPVPAPTKPETEIKDIPGILKLDGTSKTPTLYVQKLENNPDKLRVYMYGKDGKNQQGLMDKGKLGEHLRNKGYNLSQFNTWLVPQKQNF